MPSSPPLPVPAGFATALPAPASAAGAPGLDAIEAVHVAAWVELLTCEASAPTVKQELAALRRLFDWLVIGQVLPANPATAVRGPAHSVSVGKTPVLSAEQACAKS